MLFQIIIISTATGLRVDNPGHGPEARLEADQVEAEANQHHGAVVAGAVLGYEHRLLPRPALIAGAGLRLHLIVLVPGPGHAAPRDGVLLGVIITKPTVLENQLVSVMLYMMRRV